MRWEREREISEHVEISCAQLPARPEVSSVRFIFPKFLRLEYIEIAIIHSLSIPFTYCLIILPPAFPTAPSSYFD
jgi:hypothetical protein